MIRSSPAGWLSGNVFHYWSRDSGLDSRLCYGIFLWWRVNQLYVQTITLQINQTKTELEILNIARRDQIRNEGICGTTKLEDAASTIIHLKWNWWRSRSKNGPQKVDLVSGRVGIPVMTEECRNAKDTLV